MLYVVTWILLESPKGNFMIHFTRTMKFPPKVEFEGCSLMLLPGCYDPVSFDPGYVFSNHVIGISVLELSMATRS